MLSALSTGAPAIQPRDAAEILRRADAYRNPYSSFVVNVDVTSYRGQRSETWQFRVYGKEGDKSLVEFVAPAEEAGKYLLMLREAMWIYIPNTSRPIRISPLQRLMGDASNGDVARSSYSVDYEAEAGGEERVDGRDTLVLDLKARDADISYGRVKLWVAKENALPVQAEYYVESGKLMKRVYFREVTTVDGKPMITGVDIQDAVRPGQHTFMRYSKLQAKQVPEKMFNKNYLGK
jgi:outer membrane lipoprotein-sorting protein